MKPIFPSIGYSRLRMEVDGEGVTTLVCAAGCPLVCKYCINPESSIRKQPLRHIFTPESLYDRVKIDALYFEATGGGVTFGGGEPLLYADFIVEFEKLAPNWKINVESSLWLPRRQIERTLGVIDHYIVDIKDTNPEIYRRYTGREITPVLSNLRYLADRVDPDRITVRLPLIEGYNDDSDRDASERLLRSMGIRRFDRFDYQVRHQ